MAALVDLRVCRRRKKHCGRSGNDKAGILQKVGRFNFLQIIGTHNCVPIKVLVSILYFNQFFRVKQELQCLADRFVLKTNPKTFSCFMIHCREIRQKFSVLLISYASLDIINLSQQRLHQRLVHNEYRSIKLVRWVHRDKDLLEPRIRQHTLRWHLCGAKTNPKVTSSHRAWWAVKARDTTEFVPCSYAQPVPIPQECGPRPKNAGPAQSTPDRGFKTKNDRGYARLMRL